MADRTNVAIAGPLSGDEVVFRRVGPTNFKREPDGTLRLSSQAFADRDLEPSVDRALLCVARGGAEYTRRVPENGVASITVAKVRSERVEKNDAKNRPIATFHADVHPDPCPNEDPDNDAHCLIRLSPEYATKKVFRRLLERLAQIALIELPPGAETGGSGAQSASVEGGSSEPPA
jgi:hypothetical protein